MSVLTYNGIILPYLKTTNFSQEAVYDESNTDRIYTRYDITAQAVINADYLGLLNANLTSAQGKPVTKATTDNAAQIMRSIQQILLEQRRPLSFTFNGQELIPQPQQGLPGFVDAKNGPQPKFVNVTQLTNVTFLVTIRIIANYWYSPLADSGSNIFVDSNANVAGNVVLSNRWSETQIIDTMNRSTYRRQGRYIVRSDNINGYIADQVRTQTAVLGVYRNFLRQRAEYRIDPSGLAMEYTIEDLEQFKMPPNPAFRADGQYTETGATLQNPLRFGTCRLKLWGDNFTPQDRLVDVAIDIVTSKLLSRGNELQANLGPQIPNSTLDRVGYLYNAQLDVDMYRNEVSFMASVMYRATGNRFGKLDSYAGHANTVTPGSDSPTRFGGSFGVGYTPNYLAYGSADILLNAARYQDPSVRNVQLDSEDQLNFGLQPGQAGVIPEN